MGPGTAVESGNSNWLYPEAQLRGNGAPTADSRPFSPQNGHPSRNFPAEMAVRALLKPLDLGQRAQRLTVPVLAAATRRVVP